MSGGQGERGEARRHWTGKRREVDPFLAFQALVLIAAAITAGVVLF